VWPPNLPFLHHVAEFHDSLGVLPTEVSIDVSFEEAILEAVMTSWLEMLVMVDCVLMKR